MIILSRTRLGKNSIFVGSKVKSLSAFRNLMLRRNKCSDCIEDILELIKVNNAISTEESRMQ